MRVLIGVDIGTQGSKGALVSEDGRILATHSIEQQVEIPRPGLAEHDPERVWWHGFVTVVRALLQQSQVDPRDVSAVGVSGLMPVMAAVDDACRPVRTALLYADTRAHDEIVQMNERLAGQGMSPVTAQDVGPKIVWFRDHEPERWQRTRVILGAQGYIIAKLTGRYVLDSRIFALLESTTPGAGGEIQLTDAIAALLGEQRVDAYRFQGTRFDCGTHIGLVEATIRHALDHEHLSEKAREVMERALLELGVTELG